MLFFCIAQHHACGCVCDALSAKGRESPKEGTRWEDGWNCARFPELSNDTSLVEVKLPLRIDAIVGGVLSVRVFVSFGELRSLYLHHHHFGAGK
jgi:hypothetical protein